MAGNPPEVSTRLGREVVAEIAPDELPMFDYFASRYGETNSVDLAFLTREERQGGLGLPGSDVIITYVVLALIQPIVMAATRGALDGIKDVSRDTVKTILTPYATELTTRLQVLLASRKPDAKTEALKAFVDDLQATHSKRAGHV